MERLVSSGFSLRRVWVPALGLALAAAGCSGDDGGGYVYPPDAAPTAFTLQLLHASDMEAGSEAVEYAPRFSAILDSLRDAYPAQTVVLSSGDNYLPGPFFSASETESEAIAAAVGIPAPGRADIMLLNAMGFQASVFGNHEFDLGPAAVASLIQREAVTGPGGEVRVYPGTAFPYLSANLDFSDDADLQALVTGDRQLSTLVENRIARSTLIRMLNGELIGVVGATTPTLAAISSPGADIVIGPTDMQGNTLPQDYAALAEVIQAEVDALAAQGVNKIILVAHMQQLAIEKELASLLSGVDVIVAGGSNTIIADETDRLRAGDRAVDAYPLQLVSASGEPVLLVNTDGNYHYVGRLVVTFDARGVVQPGSVDPEESGIYAADEPGASALAPIAAVEGITAAVADVMRAKDGNLLGRTSVFLDGLRTSVRVEETNFGDLAADANLALAREVDESVALAIQNGGGIRGPIGVFVFPPGSTRPEDVIKAPPAANPLAGKEEGHVSQIDIENALRFNNDLSLVTLTAAQLQAVMEHGVAATAAGVTPGRFPQVSGMKFSFDPTKEPGQRVINLVVGDTVVIRDGAVQGGVGPFRVVTLGFLASGGDGYPFPTDAAANQVNLRGSPALDPAGITFAEVGTEQHALAWYLLQNFPPDTAAPFNVAETPAAGDERIQNLSARADTVLPAPGARR
jgi:2',3'-cyclic-nucleotide 2'-phosphodiesterase (5'-nucleotidase family)